MQVEYIYKEQIISYMKYLNRKKKKEQREDTVNLNEYTLSSSGFPAMLRSAEYISAEKHCGVSKWIDKLPSLVSTVNHAGMLT